MLIGWLSLVHEIENLSTPDSSCNSSSDLFHASTPTSDHPPLLIIASLFRPTPRALCSCPHPHPIQPPSAMADHDQHPSCNAIVLHPLADFSSAYPPVFVIDLKQSFIHGTGKSTVKFHTLRKQVIQALPTAPPPGPATFVIRCLEALTLIDEPYSEGLGHLLTSALNRLDVEYRPPEDSSIARKQATALFCSALNRERNLEARVTVKLVEVFGVRLSDVDEVLDLQKDGDRRPQAEAFIEPFLLDLIRSHSYNSAISLLKHFYLQRCASQEFLVNMVNEGQLELAGQWASHLGKDMVCFLVQFCTEMGMFKTAYRYVQHYQLNDSFPDACYLYRRSSLRRVVVKGLWDRSGSASDEELHLAEHLITTAMGDNTCLKAEGICNLCTAKDISLCHVQKDENRHFLRLTDFFPEEKIIWVDSFKELDFATRHFESVAMVGIDCEWKANRIKGCGTNKVAILQVATPTFVFIFDLIKLFEQDRGALDACIKSVFHSSTILKLGYAVRNDLERLSQSYQELECFHICQSVLDLQRVATKGAKGGLSGLAKVVLGSHMDKQMRMSDWEKRPLSTKQLHYAALDAVVLLSIFGHISSRGLPPTNNKLNWKLHVVFISTAHPQKEFPLLLKRF